MKTFVVWKKTFNEANDWEHTGYETGFYSTYEADAVDKSKEDHFNAGGNFVSHFELPVGKQADEVSPVLESGIWTLQDDGPKVSAKQLASHDAQIQVKYDEMVSDIYAQMEITFGTKSDVSSQAYYTTWMEMVDTPSDYAGKVSARLNTTSYNVGDALDTDGAVAGYATECLAAAKAYGVWRMERIEQFRTEKAAILAS